MKIGLIIITVILLTGCFRPPYNDFQDDYKRLKQMGTLGSIGAGTGAVIGTVAGSAGIGTAIGGGALAAYGFYKNTKTSLIKEMDKQHIQLVDYGNTLTLIVPTDRYYTFNNSHFNELAYPGLNNIAKLLSFYPNTTVYVTGFTDNVGTRHHKNMLSQARAETMLTFLWANGIPAQRLQAEGYGDKYDVADNNLIHGSALNRRIEIQWIKCSTPMLSPYLTALK